jgi:hypothetical protein
MTRLLATSLILAAAAAASLSTPAVAAIGPTDPAQPPRPMTIETITQQIARTEAALLTRMRQYRPVAEVYIQKLTEDDLLGTLPTGDAYFLGQLTWRNNAPRFDTLQPQKRIWQLPTVPMYKRVGKNVADAVSAPFVLEYLPDGLVGMTAADWRYFDPAHYAFTYVRREFLGEARCLVFEVRPRGRKDEGFTGRVWVEDRDYAIVRINGINRVVDNSLTRVFRKKLSFHFDTWRANVQPGVWVPASVYFEEADLEYGVARRKARFNGRVRLWGYQARGVQTQQEFAAIEIDEPSVRDSSATAQLSPIQGQRQWEREAEDNVLERLTTAGLLAPPGPVDKLLETVVTNLEITNQLDFDRPARCRVLLTAPFESFMVGRTIVLSRGLIDVLPDEASLAMVLAHELSHLALGHRVIDTRYAFSDRMMVPDTALLSALRLAADPSDETAADAKAIELLEHSPYADKLASAGLFLRAVAARAHDLPNLIRPRLGDRIAKGDETTKLRALMQRAPALEPTRVDQIAALPLDARLVVEPWSGRVDLLRAPAERLASVREKLSFGVTPLVPFVKYVDAVHAAASR